VRVRTNGTDSENVKLPRVVFRTPLRSDVSALSVPIQLRDAIRIIDNLVSSDGPHQCGTEIQRCRDRVRRRWRSFASDGSLTSAHVLCGTAALFS
jgi:hypothetical protein